MNMAMKVPLDGLKTTVWMSNTGYIGEILNKPRASVRDI